jgi:protein arginine kinase
VSGNRGGGSHTDFRGGEWLGGHGPEADIAICTRVRLARNLRGYAFSPRMGTEEAAEVTRKATSVLTRADMPEQLSAIDLGSLDELDRTILVERHLISRDLATSKRPRSVTVNEGESVAVMVNEEDHLRMQVFASGLQPMAAWRRAEALDEAVMEHLPLSWSEEFGFLTSCPTNTGTGLRLSVMVHLPGLVWSDEIEKATNTAQKIHLAVRGLYGEGSRALGDFYQVSNQVTLGHSEPQILSDVERAVTRILKWEREVRAALLRGPARNRTLDRVHRALGTLERAQILSSEEALGCLSALRMGIHHDLVEGFDVDSLNRALLLSQPGHLQRYAKERMSAEDRDLRRAHLVREMLGCHP